MRIGEALGLRHEDLAAAEREVAVVPRDNGNRARSKSREPRLIPVSAGLIRLYADYLNGEYGSLDCDYVFVNLWGEPRGHPLGYPAAYDLVRRLRRRTGIGFDPHWCRHTAATRMLRDGVPIEVVSRLPWPRRPDHHFQRVWAPDRRRRPRGAGTGGLVHRAGGAAMTSPAPVSSASPGAGSWRARGQARPERPDNLDRWNIPAYQLVTLILMRCGLRITDALGLPGDCIVRDANGAPYLIRSAPR